jgi:hypothetical protein
MALDFNQRRKSVLDAMGNSIRPPLPAPEHERPLTKLNLSTTPPLPAPTEGVGDAPSPPTPSAPSSARQSPISIGPSLGGKQGVDRLRTIRAAMESADPTSDVKVRGDQVDITPPRMKGVNEKGFWRKLGEGALTGLAMSDPNGSPAQILGSIAGGGALAGTETGTDQLRRKFDLSRLDNDIMRGLKIGQEQAELDKLQRPQVFAPRVETDENGNLVSIQGGIATPVRDAQGIPVKAKSGTKYRSEGGVVYEETPEGLRPVLDTRVDVDIDGKKFKVSPNTAATATATMGEQRQRRTEREEDRAERRLTRDEEREAKRQAATEAAAAADRAAQDHLTKRAEYDKQLSQIRGQLRAMGPVSPDDPQRIELESAAKRLQDAVDYEQREADNQFELRDKANSDLRSVPASKSATGGGQRWSASRWAAANKGGDVEKAKQAAKAAGYEVVE